MKSFDLQATHENIIRTFTEDAIGRSTDVIKFVKLLNLLEGSYSIAVEAPWGAGKSFFIKQTKLVIDAHNDFTKFLDEDDKKSVIDACTKLNKSGELDIIPQVSVYYDAWLNDNDEDPILSLIYTIIKSLNTDFDLKDAPNIFKIAGSIANILSGKSVSDVLSSLNCDDPFNIIINTKDVHEKIKEFFCSLLAERGDRLIIFVDELDRCKPTFAIKLLERIKHYFCNDAITFVFSVNVEELQHTVKRYYGDNYDACRYLDRFFDFRIDLPPANMSKFYSSIGLNDERHIYFTICNKVINEYNFSMREISRYYSIAKSTINEILKLNDMYYSSPKSHAVQFSLLVFIPVMIGLKVFNHTEYESFIQGKDFSPLIEIFSENNSEVFEIFDYLLSRDEVYDSRYASEGVNVVDLKEKIKKVYDAVFVHSYTTGYREISIGRLTFDISTKSNIMKTVSGLSDYASYEL